jgi:hypothetical protein
MFLYCNGGNLQAVSGVVALDDVAFDVAPGEVGWSARTARGSRR